MMKQQLHNRGSRGEKSLAVVAVLVLLLVAVCLMGIICEPSHGTELPPAVVTASSAAGNEDGPRIVGGFVPERRLGGPPPNDSSVVLSWNFINALFALIIALEILVFPLLFWLWFGKEQRME